MNTKLEILEKGDIVTYGETHPSYAATVRIEKVDLDEERIGFEVRVLGVIASRCAFKRYKVGETFVCNVIWRHFSSERQGGTLTNTSDFGWSLTRREEALEE